jgi:hypothetical protein
MQQDGPPAVATTKGSVLGTQKLSLDLRAAPLTQLLQLVTDGELDQLCKILGF